MVTCDIVLPALGQWAQQHLASVLVATTPVAFSAAFDRFIAPNATVTFNGETLTRNSYKEWLSAGNASCQVTFGQVLEVPVRLAGVVSLVYNVTCGSAQVVISSLHLSINRYKNEPGDCDPRKVGDVNHISNSTQTFTLR
ncbi:hypothetical protein FB451DRAFT_1146178 [Mycena latifolia]|nr:hypothetical protein FB451DRAFT_1146178 [Mycena latifolia]